MRRLISSGSPYESTCGFSRAVRIDDRILVAGTAPMDPTGATVGAGDPAAQARRCFDIIREALQEAGATLDDVVRTRMFLTRVEDWDSIAQVHGEFFHDIRPAATALIVNALLREDWLVEIEAEAVLGASAAAAGQPVVGS